MVVMGFLLGGGIRDIVTLWRKGEWGTDVSDQFSVISFQCSVSGG
jgi:hypothetical protein